MMMMMVVMIMGHECIWRIIGGEVRREGKRKGY
jgi:hypothetical protein